jgi:hypothetical protein
LERNSKCHREERVLRRSDPHSLAGDCFGEKTPRNDTAATCFLEGVLFALKQSPIRGVEIATIQGIASAKDASQ